MEKQPLIRFLLFLAFIAIAFALFKYAVYLLVDGRKPLPSPTSNVGTLIEKATSSRATINGFTVDITLADTEAKRDQGLSDTASLGENKGMLFVFDKPGLYGFWMKDMHYPLDIIFISKEKKVIGVAEKLSPATFPNAFGPNTPALYVLEINAGLAGKYHIKKGDEVKLLY